jgi:SAM-dependent methyltransferase
MAHFQQLRFVEIASRHAARDWTGLSVLEIGSHNVNGSIRPFFAGSAYVGVDLSEGKDVDVVASGHEVAFPDGSFDLTICCECFEHNPRWLETFANMYRMTKAGGLVVVTCASRGRREHGTARSSPEESPGTAAVGWNYYRNLNRPDFERRLDLGEMFQAHAFFDDKVSKDLYFVGKKGNGSSPLTLDVGSLRAELCANNSLVVADEPFRFKRLSRAIWDAPLKMAERLPDGFYQDFVIFWTSAERAIRRLPPAADKRGGGGRRKP